MTSSTPVPMSDVEVPLGRQISNRGSIKGSSFRRGSMRRADSLTGDSIPADEMIMRSEDEEDPANSSLRLSAALAAEREETRLRLCKELEEDEDEDEDSSGDEDDDDGGDGAGASKKGVTMSLMDLLEETDRQAGIDGPTYRFEDEEEVEEEEEEEEEEEVKGGGGDGGGGGGGGEAACCVCMVKHKGIALVPCGHTYCKMCSREMWVQKGHCPACTNFVSEVLEIF